MPLVDSEGRPDLIMIGLLSADQFDAFFAEIERATGIRPASNAAVKMLLASSRGDLQGIILQEDSPFCLCALHWGMERTRVYEEIATCAWTLEWETENEMHFTSPQSETLEVRLQEELVTQIQWMKAQEGE